MRYSAPGIEDFGKIERVVHSIFSPPNEGRPPESNIPPATAPTASGGNGGSGSGLLGLLGLGGVVAAIAARNGDAIDPVAGPLEEDESAKASE